MKNRQNGTQDVFLRCLLDGSLFKKYQAREALIAYTLFLTGAKPKELVNLKREHVDLDVPSLKLHVEFPISQKAKDAFIELFKIKSTHVFCTSKGNQLSIRRIEQIVKRIALEIGSSYTTPRAFRKLFLEQALVCQEIKKTRLKSVELRNTLNNTEQHNLKDFLKNESIRNQTLILTLLETGIRISELVSLKSKNIFSNHILISKDIAFNNQDRKILISKNLSNYWQQNKKQKQLSVRRFEQICNSIGLQMATTLTPSILRATAIKNLLKSQSKEEVAFQVGLTSDITYTHGFGQVLQQHSNHQSFTIQESVELTIRKDRSNIFSSSFIYRKSRTRLKRGDRFE